MKLPVAELLSLEECQLIAERSLEEQQNIKLLDAQLEACSKELIGYMGEYYKLRLIIQNGQHEQQILQYFVKSMPHNNPVFWAECERKGFFRKESSIYMDLLPHLKQYVSEKLFPQCYYKRQDLMVLEDLTQQYEHLKSQANYTLAHCKLVLQQLAALHAASIAWEQQQQFCIGERFKDVLYEMQLTSQNEWYLAGIKGIVFLANRHAKYQNDSAQRFINEKLYDILYKADHIIQPSKTIRNVLCHRDIWDRNIFYKFANKTDDLPTTCCFVDYQLAKYCAPTLDVLFMLYITPTASLRHEIYDVCLEHYFECLQQEFSRLELAADTITKADFLEHCRHARIAALILWAICEPLTKLPKHIYNKMRSEESSKFDYYLNTERSEFFLRIMQMVDGYEQMIMAPIEELLDYLLENEELFRD